MKRLIAATMLIAALGIGAAAPAGADGPPSWPYPYPAKNCDNLHENALLATKVKCLIASKVCPGGDAYVIVNTVFCGRLPWPL